MDDSVVTRRRNNIESLLNKHRHGNIHNVAPEKPQTDSPSAHFDFFKFLKNAQIKYTRVRGISVQKNISY